MDRATDSAPRTAAERATRAELVRQLRDPTRIRDAPNVLALLLHVALVAACIVAWQHGLWPVSVVLWLAIAWLCHAALARLHESVHGMLSRSRFVNEVSGTAIGTLALTPMSVYRYVHARHHAWLGQPPDPEFVPYNRPGTSRARRLGYAWLELLLGFVVTPLLYSARTARAWPDHRPALRRRLLGEWALLIAAVGGALILVDRLGWWEPLLVGHVVPAWIAGTLQTVRKFTEHIGMTGDSIPAMTRTVAYRSRLGRFLSWTQLYVDHHGTHHRWPRIPWPQLPEATPIAYAGTGAAPFASHAAALRDTLPHLRDPKVGPQWLEA